jgi:heterodisulfide reductase subunit C/quinone-modifying oxidoreductase subunit QmoC
LLTQWLRRLAQHTDVFLAVGVLVILGVMIVPMPTYVMYLVHLMVAVPMLVIEVPFGKWSHLLYRPLALYLSAVQARARQPQASHAQAAPAVPA